MRRVGHAQTRRAATAGRQAAARTEIAQGSLVMAAGGRQARLLRPHRFPQRRLVRARRRPRRLLLSRRRQLPRRSSASLVSKQPLNDQSALSPRWTFGPWRERPWLRVDASGFSFSDEESQIGVGCLPTVPFGSSAQTFSASTAPASRSHSARRRRRPTLSIQG